LPKGNHVNQVEGAHFPPHVELWTRGNRGPLGSDIDYTILHIPNHHRALISIARRAGQLKLPQLPNMRYPVECYFERAIRYKSDDHIVRMLYAQFLIDHERPAEAAHQLESVAGMAGDNGFTMYNIGLIYADMKDYAQALTFAHKAAALGFSRPELRQRLEKVGRWVEPAASAAVPSAD
jgi:TPR repeat protein